MRSLVVFGRFPGSIYSIFTDSLESPWRRLSNLLADTIDLLLARRARRHVRERRLDARQTQARHRVATGINEALEHAVLAQDHEEDGKEDGVDGEDNHRLALRRQGDQNTGRQNYE